MSAEREIVVGSVWAHGNGEETVEQFSQTSVWTSVDSYTMEKFRRLFRWVSDPSPKVEVGTWWKSVGGGRTICRIEAITHNGFKVNLHKSIIGYERSGFLHDYEPCSPPPEVAAVDKLIAAAEKMLSAGGTGHEGVNLRAALKAVQEARK